MDRDDGPLSKERLERILGLESSDGREQIQAAAERLLAHLAARSSASGDGSADRAALERESRQLRRSLQYWFDIGGTAGAAVPGVAESEPAEAADAPSDSGPPEAGTKRLGVILLWTLVVAGLLWAGFEQLFAHPERFGLQPKVEYALLSVSAEPAGAVLRVQDTPTARVLFEGLADGRPIELPPGSVSLLVMREDCPDVWAEQFSLERGDVARYSASICLGQGEVIVRSNQVEDRLSIDGFDRGSTGPAPHRLSVGDHEIRVEKQGFEPYSARIRLRPDEQIALKAVLRPIDARASTPQSQPQVAPSASARAAQSPPSAAGGQAGPLPPGLRPRAAGPPPPGLDFLRSTRGRNGEGTRLRGGSTTWHDRVSRELVSRYDSDGSGQIDRVEETDQIPCELWLQIEQSYNQGGLGITLARLYGFDGSEWHPGALGHARAIRSATYSRMQACGLSE